MPRFLLTCLLVVSFCLPLNPLYGQQSNTTLDEVEAIVEQNLDQDSEEESNNSKLYKAAVVGVVAVTLFTAGYFLLSSWKNKNKDQGNSIEEQAPKAVRSRVRASVVGLQKSKNSNTARAVKKATPHSSRVQKSTPKKPALRPKILKPIKRSKHQSASSDSSSSIVAGVSASSGSKSQSSSSSSTASTSSSPKNSRQKTKGMASRSAKSSRYTQVNISGRDNNCWMRSAWYLIFDGASKDRGRRNLLDNRLAMMERQFGSYAATRLRNEINHHGLLEKRHFGLGGNGSFDAQLESDIKDVSNLIFQVEYTDNKYEEARQVLETPSMMGDDAMMSTLVQYVGGQNYQVSADDHVLRQVPLGSGLFGQRVSKSALRGAAYSVNHNDVHFDIRALSR